MLEEPYASTAETSLLSMFTVSFMMCIIKRQHDFYTSGSSSNCSMIAFLFSSALLLMANALPGPSSSAVRLDASDGFSGYKQERGLIYVKGRIVFFQKAYGYRQF